VDFIFNHQNFWINLNEDTEVKQLHLDDMYNENYWEYVMLENENDFRKKMDLEEEDLDEMEKEDDNETEDYGVLDMPPSWSPKLYINKDQFNMCSILGE
jgi:outer membrane protein assembly factor BamE (lipoprotein component of BamABCDE complex)